MSEGWSESELDAAMADTALMGTIGHGRILPGGRIIQEGRTREGVSGPPVAVYGGLSVPPLPNQLPYELPREENYVALDKTREVHLNGRVFTLDMEEFLAVLKIVTAASVRAAQNEMLGLFTSANEDAINGLQDAEVSE